MMITGRQRGKLGPFSGMGTRWRLFFVGLPLILFVFVWIANFRINHPPLTPGDRLLREIAADCDTFVLYNDLGFDKKEIARYSVPGKNLLEADNPLTDDLRIAPESGGLPVGFVGFGGFRPKIKLLRGKKEVATIWFAPFADGGEGILLFAPASYDQTGIDQHHYMRLRPYFRERFYKRLKPLLENYENLD